jgi:hypothetical protein
LLDAAENPLFYRSLSLCFFGGCAATKLTIIFTTARLNLLVVKKTPLKFWDWILEKKHANKLLTQSESEYFAKLPKG